MVNFGPPDYCYCSVLSAHGSVRMQNKIGRPASRPRRVLHWPQTEPYSIHRRQPHLASRATAVTMIECEGQGQGLLKTAHHLHEGRRLSIARLNVDPFTDKSGLANRVADRSRQ